MFYNKSRYKLLIKNREGMSVIMYFTLLFTIDYLEFMDLYDQNIINCEVNNCLHKKCRIIDERNKKLICCCFEVGIIRTEEIAK